MSLDIDTQLEFNENMKYKIGDKIETQVCGMCEIVDIYIPTHDKTRESVYALKEDESGSIYFYTEADLCWMQP